MLDLSKIYNFIHTRRKDIHREFLSIFEYFFIRVYTVVIFLLNLIIWLIARKMNNNVSQDLVILHYNIDFGVDLIGNVSKIFTIPFIGLLIIFINFILLFNLSKHKHFQFLAHLLLIGSLFVNLFLLFSISAIYFINFR